MYRGVEAMLAVGANVPMFFEIVRVLEILMLHWKIFRLLLLVKIKVTNFIENSSNLPPPHSTGATAPLLEKTL